MNEDIKNGLLVAGVGVLLYLIYREMNKGVTQKLPSPPMIETLTINAQTA